MAASSLFRLSIHRYVKTSTRTNFMLIHMCGIIVSVNNNSLRVFVYEPRKIAHGLQIVAAKNESYGMDLNKGIISITFESWKKY